MDDRKKILLSTKDVITRSNEDIFINIDLQRTFNEIQKEKYDNDFDVQKQFQKERNLSISYRVYGIVDSTVRDCDNLEFELYSKEPYASESFVSIVKTEPLTSEKWPVKNVFGFKKGKYLLTLDNYQYSEIYMVFLKFQSFYQKMRFYDSSGKLIDYGTETVEIDDNGNVEEVNNNFSFFYNKHWIKKDIDASLVLEQKWRPLESSQFCLTIAETPPAIERPIPAGEPPQAHISSVRAIELQCNLSIGSYTYKITYAIIASPGIYTIRIGADNSDVQDTIVIDGPFVGTTKTLGYPGWYSFATKLSVFNVDGLKLDSIDVIVSETDLTPCTKPTIKELKGDFGIPLLGIEY